MRQDLTSALIGARFVRSFLLRLRGTMPGTMRQSLMINLLWKPWPMASSMILDDWPIRNGPFSRSLNVAIVSPILGGRCRSFHISPKHDPSSYFGHIAMTGHVMSCHVGICGKFSVQNFIGGLVDYCLMHVDSHLSFWRNPHLKALKDHFCLVSIWLVVEPPLWKIWKSIGMIISNIWKNKNMFQTTNQLCFRWFTNSFWWIYQSTSHQPSQRDW